jgi:predicted double-glycine peptidase
MPNRFPNILIPILACCIGIVLCFLILTKTKPQAVSVSVQPQCAHWSIFRTAQLIGVPTGPGEVQRLLPNQPQGHTLAQVVETLAKIGIDAEGYRDDWDTLSKQHFPCIVHLEKPEHYIVVSGIEPERGYIHIFDDAGNRTRQKRETFEKRWTGYSLHIKKNTDFFVAKSKEDKPHILFDHLILDKGDIPAVGEPTEFVFPIHNTGTSDLIIEDVKVNCGCLKSEKPAKPIPPGKSDTIKLFYSVEPKRGVFTQTAAVKTNDPARPVVVLSACGFTGVEVRIEPSRITLDRFFTGRETSYRCFVRYTGEWNDFQVELESTDLTGAKLVRHKCLPLDKSNNSDTHIHAKTPTSKSAVKNNRILELVFEPTGSISEKVSGTVKLKTNVAGYEHFTLNVFGTIEPPIQAFPGTIDIEKTTSIMLVSLVDKPFSIVGVDCDSALTCQYDYSKRKEQTIQIIKTGIPKSHNLILRCQLDNEPLPINLPLTILDNALSM